MSISVDEALTANPSWDIRLPETVRFRTSLSATRLDQSATVTLSIAKDWDICFETEAGPVHSVSMDVTLTATPTPWTRRLKLVLCQGGTIPEAIRVTASVKGKGSGTAKTSCMIGFRRVL